MKLSQKLCRTSIRTQQNQDKQSSRGAFGSSNANLRLTQGQVMPGAYTMYIKRSIAQAPISMLPLRAQATMNNLVETWSNSSSMFCHSLSRHLDGMSCKLLASSAIRYLFTILRGVHMNQENIIPLRSHRHSMQGLLAASRHLFQRSLTHLKYTYEIHIRSSPLA